MKFIIAVFALCFCSLVSLATAASVSRPIAAVAALPPPIFNLCNGCTNVEYMTLAASLGNSQGIGYKLTADFTNNRVTEWQVTREPNGRGFTYYADPATVQTYAADGFAAWSRLLKFSPKADLIYSVSNPSPTGFPTNVTQISATGWASGGQGLNGIEQWLEDIQSSFTGAEYLFSNPALGAILDVMQTGIKIPGIIPNLVVLITNTDGSVVTVTWTGTPPAVLTKIVDKYGNTIPLTKNDFFNKTFTFGDGGSLNNFTRYATQIWGVSVTPLTVGTVAVGGIITCDADSCTTERK